MKSLKEIINKKYWLDNIINEILYNTELLKLHYFINEKSNEVEEEFSLFNLNKVYKDQVIIMQLNLYGRRLSNLIKFFYDQLISNNLKEDLIDLFRNIHKQKFNLTKLKELYINTNFKNQFLDYIKFYLRYLNSTEFDYTVLFSKYKADPQEVLIFHEFIDIEQKKIINSENVEKEFIDLKELRNSDAKFKTKHIELLDAKTIVLIIRYLMKLKVFQPEEAIYDTTKAILIHHLTGLNKSYLRNLFSSQEKIDYFELLKIMNFIENFKSEIEKDIKIIKG